MGDEKHEELVQSTLQIRDLLEAAVPGAAERVSRGPIGEVWNISHHPNPEGHLQYWVGPCTSGCAPGAHRLNPMLEIDSRINGQAPAWADLLVALHADLPYLLNGLLRLRHDLNNEKTSRAAVSHFRNRAEAELHDARVSRARLSVERDALVAERDRIRAELSLLAIERDQLLLERDRLMKDAVRLAERVEKLGGSSCACGACADCLEDGS